LRQDDQSIGTATALLLRWRAGDKTALDRLMPLVYADLRRVARARLQSDGDHSLQPTALVHEVYLRLVDLDRMTINDRVHFFAMAARPMRQILVDQARRRKANKRRGGGASAGIDNNSLPANVPLAIRRIAGAEMNVPRRGPHSLRHRLARSRIRLRSQH
jgi:RNA polymerase sigma factor (TIGR02999 family)